MNKYECSDGSRVSQATINKRLSEAYRDKHELAGIVGCEAYPGLRADDNDHTISQKRCKELHKTELIWDPANFVSSSRKAHMEWESWKGSDYFNHANMAERMLFLKQNDPEGYAKRINYEY